MTCTRLTQLLVATLSVFSAVPASAITATPSWKPKETVDLQTAELSLDGGGRVLAFDHHGNPSIAFVDDNDFSLDYARRVPGIGWVDVEIDSSSTASPSVAFDRYERPAISYESLNSVKFAHFDGSVWQTETVDSVSTIGTSLAFDLLGRPAIAYEDFSDFSLKYVLDTDGDFSFVGETPVTVSNVLMEGIFPSLAFDPLNRPMIAHGSFAPDEELRFSVQEPGIGWVTTTVDANPGASASLASLAIDPDTGYPAIAHGGGTAGLRFAAWNGDDWDLTTIDPTTNAGVRLSLAFDPADGHPAISYNDETAEELNFAWHNGSIWQTQTVDSGTTFLQSSVAFNDFGNGFASIAYVDASHDLFYVEDPPAVVPESASALLMLIGLASGFLRRRDTTVVWGQ